MDDAAARTGLPSEESRRRSTKFWAYRYRVGGRGSRRVQPGGFASEQAAPEALERTLERLRRENGLIETPTLREFVELYLAQHDGEPETIAKLSWLLAKAVEAFGDRRLGQLRSPAIAAWRVTIPEGHRFDATQALRQVLARAVLESACAPKSCSARFATSGWADRDASGAIVQR
jgi:hypothetical protein